MVSSVRVSISRAMIKQFAEMFRQKNSLMCGETDLSFSELLFRPDVKHVKIVRTKSGVRVMRFTVGIMKKMNQWYAYENCGHDSTCDI